MADWGEICAGNFSSGRESPHYSFLYCCSTLPIYRISALYWKSILEYRQPIGNRIYLRNHRAHPVPYSPTLNRPGQK